MTTILIYKSKYPVISLVSVVIVLLSIQTTSAQDYSFRHLTTRSGIAGPYINDIQQDGRGFIWFATQTGLSKFDGYNFTNYRNNSEFSRQLTDNSVTELQLLPDNRMLIGHDSGVDLLMVNTETFKPLQLPATLPKISRVWDLQIDEDGDLWVISNQHLYHFPSPDFEADTLKGTAHHYPMEENDELRDMEFYQGEIWTGTTKGIYIFNPGSKSIREITSSDPSILNILETVNWEVATGPDANLYMSFLGGLLRYNKDSNQLENMTDMFSLSTEQLTEPGFQDMFVDAQNNLWFGTSAFGAYKWNLFTNELTQFAPDNSNENTVNSPDIHFIYQDDQNNIWFGYHNLGVSLMYSQSWNYSFEIPYPDIEDDDPKNAVSDVKMDQQSIVWATTEGGLIKGLGSEKSKLIEYNWESLNIEPQNSAEFIAATNSHLYFSLGQGISDIIVFDTREETFSQLGLNIRGTPIPLPPMIDENIYYMGTFMGRQIIQLDITSKEFEIIEISAIEDSASFDFSAAFPDYISGSNVYLKEFMLSDDENILGTYMLDQDSLSVSTYEFPLNGDLDGVNRPLFSSYAPGITYFNTRSGLIQIDNRNRTSQLLFEDQVPLLREGTLQMTEDNQGYIWMSNQTGLMRLDPLTESISYFEIPNNKKPINYGLPSTLSNGEIIFPGEGGYIRFNPAELREAQPIGETIITSVQTLEDTYKTIYSSESIEIGSDNNSLTFYFIGMNFRDPNSTHYRYRILGSENEEWKQIGSQRSVFIPNIASGEYTFELQSGSQFGSFNEQTASLEFVILPPWWNTIPAYFGYALVFGGLVFGVDRFQRRRVLQKERERTRKKELRQAREIESAYKDLEQAHKRLKSAQDQLVQQEKLASLGQLTAGIAHEIKNPLNFVNNFSDLNVELVEEVKQDLEALNKKLPDSERKELLEAIAALDDIDTNLKKIYEHGFRADQIVKSMLQHSRGGSSEKAPTNINDLLREYVNLAFHGMRAGADPIMVEIKFQLEENLAQIPLIPEDFSRVIVNLCKNSFDAMREKLQNIENQTTTSYMPTLRIRTRSENNIIEVEIEDNGPGIPEDMKDKIMQPFFTTKKGTAGTGLGLSITNDIIKAHGGSLDIESEPGKTVFTITLSR